MADVALTGGSGLVGGDLITHLVARGDSVRALVRSDAAARVVEERGAESVQADLFDHDAIRDAAWGADTLFHVAGVNETCPKDPDWMDRVNVDATRSVVRAAGDAGVGRVVYTSSGAAIGEQEGIIGKETITHSGEYVSRYARSKHLGELAALEEGAASSVDVVVVNPSSVQGPGRATGSARILLYALKAKRPVLFDTTISIVDVRDCSRGHMAAAERGRSGQRYLLSGASLKVSEAVAMAADLLGRTIKPRWLPEGAVRALGSPSAALGSLFGADVCPDLVRTLLHGHRFDGSLAERELGIHYTPAAETFADTIAWFRAEGLIAS